MKRNAIAAALVVAAAAVPVIASAQTAPPVSVDAVQIFPSTQGQSIPLPGQVSLDFVNRNTVAATQVQFAVTSHGQQLAVLTDTGSFAPGVTVHDSWQNDGIDKDQQVRVARVTFADGTTWSNDAVPARRQADVSLR